MPPLRWVGLRDTGTSASWRFHPSYGRISARAQRTHVREASVPQVLPDVRRGPRQCMAAVAAGRLRASDHRFPHLYAVHPREAAAGCLRRVRSIRETQPRLRHLRPRASALREGSVPSTPLVKIEINLLPGQGRLCRGFRAQEVTCLRCGGVCEYVCRWPAYVPPDDPNLSIWDRLWDAFRRDEKLKAERS